MCVQESELMKPSLHTAVVPLAQGDRRHKELLPVHPPAPVPHAEERDHRPHQTLHHHHLEQPL